MHTLWWGMGSVKKVGGVGCCPVTLTKRGSIGIFSHKALLMQQQRFDCLTVSVSFHTPACTVVQCTVGVVVTRQQTVWTLNSKSRLTFCDLHSCFFYPRLEFLMLVGVKLIELHIRSPPAHTAGTEALWNWKSKQCYEWKNQKSFSRGKF